MTKDEMIAQLKAKFEKRREDYESFGTLRQDLVFEFALPVADAKPEPLPEGRVLFENGGVALQSHLWGDNSFSFTLDGQLLPVAVYQRERVSLSRTKDTESFQGYGWIADIPSLKEFLKGEMVPFERGVKGQWIARFFKDEVVHSTGLTTNLYLILDDDRGTLEVQYHHHFDGE